MGIFNRFSDVVNSNLNALLDQAEDPDKMIRLITQEMQQTLVELRATSAAYIADKKRLNNGLRHAIAEVDKWQAHAELAVSRNRDDLAKAALQEKAGSEAHADALRSEIIAIDSSLGKLKQDGTQLETKLANARARQKALVLRGQTARSRIKVKRHLHEVDSEAALSKFDRYERKLDEMEGEAESYDLHNRTLAQEIDALQDDQQLTRELDALKARIRVPLTTQIRTDNETTIL